MLVCIISIEVHDNLSGSLVIRNIYISLVLSRESVNVPQGVVMKSVRILHSTS